MPYMSRTVGFFDAAECPQCGAAVGADLDLGAGAYRVMLGSPRQPLDAWRCALFAAEEAETGAER